jgi:hypothetical protein
MKSVTDHRTVRRLSLAAAATVTVIGALSAVSGGAALRSGSATCTTAQKTARTNALTVYQRTMAAKRTAFFRSHADPAARGKFVKAQKAKLKTLRSAAACTAVPAGASIVANIAVPSDGPVTVGLGSVWVDDHEDGVLDSDGLPAAKLYRIDPQTNTLTGTIAHVLGDFATVSDRSVWLTSFDLNRLLRVDPSTDTVASIATGSGGDQGPEGVAYTAGLIWVANHHGVAVAEINAQDSTISATVPVAPLGPNGAQALATDGKSVWIGHPGGGEIVRIDVATRAVTSRVQTSIEPCGGIAADLRCRPFW